MTNNSNYRQMANQSFPDSDAPRPLFRPGPRTAAFFLCVAIASVGFGLYMRYAVIEQTAVGLACQNGLDSTLCRFRDIVLALFNRSVFGIGAMIVAALNLLRPSPVLVAGGLAFAGAGLVLYNTGLSGLAVALLVFSLARRAPEPA